MVTTYKDAGVDIDKGNEFVRKIVPLVKKTYTPDVLAGVGGFAAHFLLDLDETKEPVLISSTDGVGTKLKLAIELKRFSGIGIDLVAMCVNDIVCSGAKPLFFLDYFAVGKLEPDGHTEIIKGIVDGCKQAGCALIGGETAEMPDLYNKDDLDLAGFVVGIADRSRLIDGSSIAIGDLLIGIASSGLHSNGYSLVRKIVRERKLDLSGVYDDLGKPLGEILLTPTKIYSGLILNLVRNFSVRGIAHITGGGLRENVPRILPTTSSARILLNNWERPRIFDFIQREGGIEEEEMQRVFNLGVGMVIVVPPAEADDVIHRISSFGERGFIIGEVKRRKKGEPQITLE